ncbi:transposase, partial [Corynebacterium striatum]|uniref:transposase n=1 Tax=Corynebacterium striatum TaxID=43770 RepID=UPI002549EFFA
RLWYQLTGNRQYHGAVTAVPTTRAQQSERPIAHVAKEIGVSAGLLGRWVKLERERRGSSDGMSESDLRAENARLRRELA